MTTLANQIQADIKNVDAKVDAGFKKIIEMVAGLYNLPSKEDLKLEVELASPVVQSKLKLEHVKNKEMSPAYKIGCDRIHSNPSLLPEIIRLRRKGRTWEGCFNALGQQYPFITKPYQLEAIVGAARFMGYAIGKAAKVRLTDSYNQLKKAA